MKVDYDFMLKEIDEEIAQIDSHIAAEKLAGNVVKEAAERGEITAFTKLRAWIVRLQKIESPCDHKNRVYGGYSGSLWQCSDCGAKG